MAFVSIAITGAAGGSFGDLTGSFSISDDDSDRLLAYIATTYAYTPEGVARTPKEAVEACAEAIFAELIRKVRAWEREQAAAAAAASVTEIPFTKVV